MSGYKQELMEYAFSLGADKFRVAPVERFAEARPGHKPEEILPGAKSVIVMCTRLLNGALSATYRKYLDGMNDVHGIYGTYGYTLGPTFHLAGLVYALSQKIEQETDAIAVPMFTGGPLVNGSAFSLRHAAYAAGLGEFGWNGIMLTPEFGPRNRFCAVITDLELEPDEMYSGPSLCNRCGECVRGCPTQAIPAPGEAPPKVVHCGGKAIEYNDLKYWRCQVACHMITKKTGGDTDWVGEDPTLEEVNAAMHVKPLETVGLQGNPTWKCGLCMINCPAGGWKEKFGDTGLAEKEEEE